MVGLNYVQGFRLSFWIAGRLLGDGWESTCCIRTPNTNKYHQYNTKTHTVQIQIRTKWLGGRRCLFQKHFSCTFRSPGDGWEMAGCLPLAISEYCGCSSRSLQDGWGMTGWLAPTSSNDFGCHCRSPRDGWVDGWEMDGRTPVVLERPTQHIDTSIQSQQPYNTNEN